MKTDTIIIVAAMAVLLTVAVGMSLAVHPDTDIAAFVTQHQTLIAGILAVGAAVVSAFAIFGSVRLQISRNDEVRVLDLAREDALRLRDLRRNEKVVNYILEVETAGLSAELAATKLAIDKRYILAVGDLLTPEAFMNVEILRTQPEEVVKGVTEICRNLRYLRELSWENLEDWPQEHIDNVVREHFDDTSKAVVDARIAIWKRQFSIFDGDDMPKSNDSSA